MLIACKAMEHSSGKFLLIMAHNGQQLVLRLSAMDHQRQTRLDAPFHLPLKGGKLLSFILTRPIEIQAYLTDGDIRHGRIACDALIQCPLHLTEHILPVVLHLLGLQTDHRIAITWITVADVTYGSNTCAVNAGNKNRCHTCCAGTSDHLIQIVVELRSVKMGMGINILEHT